jgi:hypothetical protein
MKKYSILAVLSLIIFGLASCGSDDEPTNREPDITVVNDDIAVNAVFEDMDNYTIQVLQSSGIAFRTQSTFTNSICEGVMVEFDSESQRIEIDFGTGCTSSTGVVRKGKVILEYSGNFLIPGSKVTTILDGYEVNGLKVEGTRTLTNTGIDLINSEITLAVKVDGGKVTWPDGTSVSYSSDQVRTLKLDDQGYELSITGTANGVSRSGVSYTAATTSALEIKQDCVDSGVFLPSSGVIDFVIGGIPASVDYGTGACDKVLTVTYAGGVKEITVE